MINSSFKYRTNIYGALAIRLTLVFILLMTSRFLFYLVNKSYFPDLNFSRWASILIGGARFDLAATLYVNALFIVMQILPFNFRYHKTYQTISGIIFFITNGLAFFANSADMIYFRFTLRRSTMMVFKEFSNENNLGTIFFQSITEYWYVALIFFSLLLVLYWLYARVELIKPSLQNKWILRSSNFGLLLLIPVLFVGGVRGDFKYTTRPITMSNAGEYVSKSSEVSLVLNTPFCMIRTIGQQFYTKDNYFANSDLSANYNPEHFPQPSAPFRYENVVVIVVESFERESIGFYNHHLDNGRYRGFTPFIDSLLGKSYVSINAFANGRKSIDALPSVLTGIPAGELPFVLTPYASNRFRSLPLLLREKGYHTSFFHGAPNGSMGFKAFMNLIGVEHYYGKDEYSNDADFDGTWGIWDEPFLQFFAKTLDTIQQPFFSTVFTVSSHEPFKVPEKYKGVFPGDENPLHEATGYTDNALRKFFDTAKKMPWFKNTLFVLTADHASMTTHPEYQTAWGNMAVPILFYHPSDSLQQVNNRVIQQTDIMPTILSYLNYDNPYVAFGKDVMAPVHDNIVMNYYNGYQILQDSLLLQFNGNVSTGLYNYWSDPKMKNNLLPNKKGDSQKMETKLKAFIQQYHNRLIEDRVSIKTQSNLK